MKNLILVSFLILGTTASAQKPQPSDPKATPETVSLYRNLLKLQKEGMMFGHQDDLA